MKNNETTDSDNQRKAEICLSAGDNQNAIKYFTKYLKKNEADSCYLNRGIAHYRLKHYKRALKDFQKVYTGNDEYEINSYLTLVFPYMGSALIKLKQDREALKYLNIACKLNNPTSQTHFERATILIKFKEYKKAIRDLNKAIKILPTVSLFYEVRGKIYLKHLNQKARGLRDLKIAQELKY